MKKVDRVITTQPTLTTNICSQIKDFGTKTHFFSKKK